jgi:hypothetical protein
MLLLLILLLIFFGGGAVWATPTYGTYRSWSPFTAVLLILFLLWATGHLH